MLQADNIGVAEVEVVRGAAVGIEVALVKFESDFVGILVALGTIIDRRDESLDLRKSVLHRGADVGREGGDAALAWKVIAEEGDLGYFGDRVGQ